MSAGAAAMVVACAALAVAAVSMWFAWRAYRAMAVPPSRRMREVMGAVQAGDIERLPQLLGAIDRNLQVLERRLAEIEELMPAAVQKIGLVRFDAEPEMGGKVSFALALLDDHDDGVLITSVHRLEGTRVFLREVVGGRTEHELLPEEHKALNMAVDETLQARRRGKRGLDRPTVMVGCGGSEWDQGAVRKSEETRQQGDEADDAARDDSNRGTV